MKALTKQQVNKKYNGKYVEVTQTYDYTNQCEMYEVTKTSPTIRENMTLGQDVGTNLMYCR